MAKTREQRLQKEYRAAVGEYHRLTNYLNAACDILTKAERELLLDFADLAKREHERLRKALALRRFDQIPN